MRSLLLTAAATLMLGTPVLADTAPRYDDQCKAGHDACERAVKDKDQHDGHGNSGARGDDRHDDRRDDKKDDRHDDHKDKHDQKHANSKPGKGAGHNPHVGEDARNWKTVPADKMRRLPAAPHGQSYRVLNDHVVRVDNDTLQVIALVGLLSALN
ncbi:hypothetical protein [Falsirhodobacter algicola]|uniref:RcnB family protein n=1 Tax=Falsirhodobacter algicola TaxID=2692330 RepID=A0A8J8SKC7_9RHOB|nr:hypothetical protein [Falsirhodobacter algicola]QUS35740.1 hypothetical protein GR316_05360 [Falsirhodobacter algicola]